MISADRKNAALDVAWDLHYNFDSPLDEKLISTALEIVLETSFPTVKKWAASYKKHLVDAGIELCNAYCSDSLFSYAYKDTLDKIVAETMWKKHNLFTYQNDMDLIDKKIEELNG